MKKLHYCILVICALLNFNSCDFDDYQDDPNRTTQATPGLVLTNLIVNSFNIVDAAPMLASRMLVYTDGLDLNQYYGWTRSGFEPYDQLRQVFKLIEEAERIDQANYIAIAKFIKAYHIYNLTMTFGDVPYSEALSGFDNNYLPVYDEQEAIVGRKEAKVEVRPVRNVQRPSKCQCQADPSTNVGQTLRHATKVQVAWTRREIQRTRKQ